jgi:L-threonylcarbamoyladenylate synthase
MDTQILKEVEAAAWIRKGELVAFPTETVYGLGASIFDAAAIQKIFTTKGRPQDNPLIAHISSLEQVDAIAEKPPACFWELANVFFPGPLTLVLKKKPTVPDSVSKGLDTLAIRMPAHPIALQLIREVGEPLVAPSANLSGRPSSTCIEHVLRDFEGKIAAIVDGGPCRYGMESTVVDLVSFERPTLLRFGALQKEAIEEVLGHEIAVYTQGPKSAPGMRYRHYAPDIPVFRLLDKDALERHLSPDKKTYLLSSESLPLAHHPLEAVTFYSHLREAERCGYEEIVIYCPKCHDAALENRLEKVLENDPLPSIWAIMHG